MTIMLALTIFYKSVKDNRYMRGALTWMRPVLVGMIAAAAIMFVNTETFFHWSSVIICVASFYAVWKKVNPIYVMFAAAAVGILLYGVVM
jgi:chromate transporter